MTEHDSLISFPSRECERSFEHAPHDWQGAASEWFRCPGKASLLDDRPTRWTDAVRGRLASVRRHPGHDGPTVCACAECVLWSLLVSCLDLQDFYERDRDALEEVVREATRLSGYRPGPTRRIGMMETALAKLDEVRRG